MKQKISEKLNWGFSIIPLFASLFQAIIEQNVIVLASIYLGVLTFLIIELILSGAEIIPIALCMAVSIIVAMIPVIAIKKDLLKVRYRKAKMQRIQKKIEKLENKLNKLR